VTWAAKTEAGADGCAGIAAGGVGVAKQPHYIQITAGKASHLLLQGSSRKLSHFNCAACADETVATLSSESHLSIQTPTAALVCHIPCASVQVHPSPNVVCLVEFMRQCIHSHPKKFADCVADTGKSVRSTCCWPPRATSVLSWPTT
jgi:hypothetical protein